MLRHERSAREVPQGGRSRRAHARRVYVTGCGANLGAAGFAGLPANVVVVAKRSEETAAFVAGDVGAIGCVQADARLDRVRAFVKIQDGCSFSCNFCVIPLVRGALAQPQRRRRCSPRSTPRGTGSPRGRPHRHQPRLLPRSRRRVRPAAARPRGGATPGLDRLRLSSIEINHVDAKLVAALRETPTVSRHLHVPLQSGDDGVLRAMAGATRRRRISAGSPRSPASST